jgi:ferritin-like metal-binding protein YciE
MPETMTLHDAFLDELRDSYDAEKQLIKALPKMARAAENDTLRTAFQTHLKETQGHAQRLEQVFQSLGEKPRGKHCDGMEGIIEEGKSILEEDLEGTALDACLIAAAQRAEHYEMAAYGTLVAWAKAMGHNEAVGLLESILEEEKATDEKLTQIAESGVNEDAAARAHGGDDQAEANDSSSGSRRGSSSSARSSARGGSSASRSSGRKAASSGARKGSSRKRR